MWLLLSFLTAVCSSAQDVLAKHLSGRVSPYVTAWAWMFFSLPFLAIMLFFEARATITPGFWPALAAATVTLTLGAVFLFKAIELSDLSLTIPILSFTPMFMLVTSPFMLGESPNVPGSFGIFFIVVGSYILFYHPQQGRIWDPFRRILSTKGGRYMLLVALVFSIGANIDKIGVGHSSPVVWSLALNASVAAVLGLIMFKKVPDVFVQIRSNWPGLVLVGLAVALVMLFQMNALKLTLAPYVIAVKRTSVIMSAVWGLWFLKEQGGWQRILAAGIMLAGVLIISFAH